MEPVVEKTTGLSFGEALQVMENGGRVAREDWNKFDEFVYLWLLPKAIIPIDWIKDPMLLAVYTSEQVEVLTCEAAIRMKTPEGTVLTGWVATQTDMLAKDWCIVTL